MKEQWKQFRDTKYMVANDGRVKGHFGKILKPSEPGVFKYRSYVLKHNGKQMNCFVHRMVAECYLRNPKGKKQVNHKDGNKLNNHVSNLEWVTQAENVQHMYDTGIKKYKPLHYKGKFGAEHNRSKRVRCIESGIEYGSMSEAGRLLNIDHSSVSWSIRTGKPIYGMHFELAI